MLPVWVSLALCCVALVGCATTATPDVPLASGTSRRFAHTVETSASPQSLWRVWTDAEAWPAWDTELDSVSLDGPFRDGASGRLVPKRGPSARFSVADVDDGRAYTLVTRLPLGALRVRRTWVPAGAGRIAVTHEVSFHGLGGRLLAGRLGPGFRAALPAVMARLAARAEALGS